MDITIYHNPACGTSLKVVARLHESGHQPHIIEYLKTPPSRDELAELLKSMAISPRELLRVKEEEYVKLGAAGDKLSDEKIIDLIHQHPILMNRPIVKTPLGTRLCRPAETVTEILPQS